MKPLPFKRKEMIAWGQERLEPFTTKGEALGLSTEIVSEFRAALVELQNGAVQSEAAKLALQAQTARVHAAEQRFVKAAKRCVAAAKLKAEQSENANKVYETALLPIPGAKARREPTDARDLVVSLRSDGAVYLRWKGSVDGGQFFSVWRKMDGPWVQIGSVGTKDYVDETLPTGHASATYMVRAHKGAEISPGCTPVVLMLGRVS